MSDGALKYKSSWRLLRESPDYDHTISTVSYTISFIIPLFLTTPLRRVLSPPPPLNEPSAPLLPSVTE